jgi:phasin family protein
VTSGLIRIIAVEKIENSSRLLEVTSSAISPGRNRGEEPPLAADHSEIINKGEYDMDGSTGMTMDVTKTMANLTKTIEQVALFGRSNIEAIMKSGQIWVGGSQAISKIMATTAQAHLDQTMSAWKALTTVKSLKEAMDLRADLTQASFQTAFAETGKVTDVTMRLAEQTMAPIVERFTLAAKSFTRPTD